jgi:hypothetical protein
MDDEPIRPIYDPKAGRWFAGRLSAPTLRELSLRLPEGTSIADYYPDGYAARRERGPPTGRAELRTTYNKPKFSLRSLPATDSRKATDLHGGTGDSGCREMIAREPDQRPRAAEVGQVPTFRPQPVKLRRDAPSPLLHKTAWSKDEMLRLRSMANDGKSAQDIANATGRSRNAVIGQCHRAGIKLKTVSFGRPRGAYRR